MAMDRNRQCRGTHVKAQVSATKEWYTATTTIRSDRDVVAEFLSEQTGFVSSATLPTTNKL